MTTKQNITALPAGTLAASYPPVISGAQLAEILGYTPASLKSINCRRPDQLPPAVIIPGARRPRWRLCDVEAWLAAHVQVPSKNKGGRPSKREQLRRQRLAGKGGAK